MSRHSSPDARFAFLSACQTADGGSRLPDEALTIASAMQLIGFQQVIATLWSIRDDAAPDIARKIYSELLHENELAIEDTALALHHAVRAVRAQHPKDLLRWGPYVHVGP